MLYSVASQIVANNSLPTQACVCFANKSMCTRLVACICCCCAGSRCSFYGSLHFCAFQLAHCICCLRCVPGCFRRPTVEQGGIESLRHMAGMGLVFSPNKKSKAPGAKKKLILHQPILDPTYVAALQAQEGAGDLRAHIASVNARIPVHALM